MKILLNIVAGLLFINIITAQGNGNFPALVNEDSNDLEILEEKQFDGESLWGHINGGADLYLEYGFDKLLYQKVYYKGVIYRVEFYRMNDPEAAFGIFSVRRFNCNISDTLTRHICVTGNQIQSALGSTYVSISNELETPEALQLSFDLFDIVLSKVEEENYKYPELFLNTVVEGNEKIKLIKGTLGFQNGFPMWDMMFEGYENYKVFIIPVETDSSYFNMSMITFNDNETMDKFISDNEFDPSVKDMQERKTEDEFLQVLILNDKNILYLETDNDTVSIKNYINK